MKVWMALHGEMCVMCDCVSVLDCGFPMAGVALKIMQMFRCLEVDGVYWLQADMRLQCYTSQWAGYDTIRRLLCARSNDCWRRR